MITWILVANAAAAHVYSTSAGMSEKSLQLEWELSHRQSRQKGSNLLSDRPGRGRKGPAAPTPFALQPHTAPKEVEAEHFAEQVANRLEAGMAQQRYDLLAVVAPAHFLGLLTERLGAPVQKHLVARLHKDLVNLKPRDLPAHLAALDLAIKTEHRRREAMT